MKPDRIVRSGTELDWQAVAEAAELIAKQARDIAFCPPEAVDIHQMRAGYVCNAIEKIAVALKLRRREASDQITELDDRLDTYDATLGNWDWQCLSDDAKNGTAGIEAALALAAIARLDAWRKENKRP